MLPSKHTPWREKIDLPGRSGTTGWPSRSSASRWLPRKKKKMVRGNENLEDRLNRLERVVGREIKVDGRQYVFGGSPMTPASSIMSGVPMGYGYGFPMGMGSFMHPVSLIVGPGDSNARILQSSLISCTGFPQANQYLPDLHSSQTSALGFGLNSAPQLLGTFAAQVPVGTGLIIHQFEDDPKAY